MVRDIMSTFSFMEPLLSLFRLLEKNEPMDWIVKSVYSASPEELPPTLFIPINPGG